MGDSLRIAVVTTATPERLHFLGENLASIRAQTLQPIAHYVGIDYEYAGPAVNLTRTVRAALPLAEWIAQLADDDLADPEHLATLASGAGYADIVYSWCRVEGREGWNPNSDFDAARLRLGNYIPATSLIRSSLIEQLGGWRSDAALGFEDWDFWLRALDVGARFRCIPAVTWTYRFHGHNQSFGGVAW